MNTFKVNDSVMSYLRGTWWDPMPLICLCVLVCVCMVIQDTNTSKDSNVAPIAEGLHLQIYASSMPLCNTLQYVLLHCYSLPCGCQVTNLDPHNEGVYSECERFCIWGCPWTYQFELLCECGTSEIRGLCVGT